MDLDDVVPVADHVTRQSRVIDAPPAVVWEELHRLRLSSLPVSLLLSAVRALPVLLAGRGRRRGGLDRTFLDVVPIPELASDPPSHVVFGGVLQAWRLAGGKRPAHTLTPVLVHRDGRLAAVSGSRGGGGQPQINVMSILRAFDLGMDVGAVLDAPRWLVGGIDWEEP